MYVWIYVCMYVCMYIRTYIYVYMHIYIYIHTLKRIWGGNFSWHHFPTKNKWCPKKKGEEVMGLKSIWENKKRIARRDACLYVCMRVCVCAYVCMCVRLCVHMCACMHAWCIYVRLHVYMYVCVCMYVCMYVCMHLHMYVCMYVHTCMPVCSMHVSFFPSLFFGVPCQRRTRRQKCTPLRQKWSSPPWWLGEERQGRGDGGEKGKIFSKKKKSETFSETYLAAKV